MKQRIAGLAALLIISIFATPPAFAQPASDSTASPPAGRARHFAEIDSALDREYPSLERLYIHLHSHPEISFQEERTGARIAEELTEAGFEVAIGVGGHGVVGVMKNGSGPTLMIRTDTDALPVLEETGLEFASNVTTIDDRGGEVSVMHACGHDIHMTSFVAAARLLSQMREAWKGTLVMIAQPAEERGAGARAMLADGLYTRFPRPDFALALHVDSFVQSGKVAYVENYAMANVDSVDILIRGVGGHGAYPEATKDPIVVAAQVVMALQTIVSREISPLDPSVITVGSIHGGTKHNVIPNEVKLQLTVRSYTDAVREHLLTSIERVARGVAMTAGIPDRLAPTITIRPEHTPALYNSPELVRRVIGVIGEFIGQENIVQSKPSMGGEDFARYGREEPRVPIFLFNIGAVSARRMAESRRPGGDPLPSLHSSRFRPDYEPTIKTGARAMTAAALELLE